MAATEPEAQQLDRSVLRARRARQFRVIRADIGATQAALADYLGKSVSTIGCWERGRSPIPDEVMAEMERVVGTRSKQVTKEANPIVTTTPRLDESGPTSAERIDRTLFAGEHRRIESVLGEILREILHTRKQ